MEERLGEGGVTFKKKKMIASALKAQKETGFNDEAKAFIVSHLNAQNKAAMDAAAATNAAVTVSGTTAKASTFLKARAPNVKILPNAATAPGAANASKIAIASPSEKTKSILKEILRKAKE